MSTTATIKHDHIELDMTSWLQERTAGAPPELNQCFSDFDVDLTNATVDFSSGSTRLDRLRLFINARAGKSWSNAEFAILHTDTNTGIVSLSDSLLTYRYIDPEHGAVAFVTKITGSTIGNSSAYHDVVLDSEDWRTIQAQIECPNNHNWIYRNGDLIDEFGIHCSPADVFPNGQIITHDNDGASRILCPDCGANCRAGGVPD